MCNPVYQIYLCFISVFIILSVITDKICFVFSLSILLTVCYIYNFQKEFLFRIIKRACKIPKSEQRAVAPETILNYIKYCCDAYLFYQVKRQDLQGKQLLSTNEKYYIADHGIRQAIYGGNMRDINLILENIVYLEALRRGYTVTVGKTGDKEVDFICSRQNKKLYIQVTYLLATDETIQRKFGVYNHIRDNYPKYVVSLDGKRLIFSHS